MDNSAIILASAALLDATIGDPVYRWHPVRLIGDIIKTYEHVMFKMGFTGRLSGMLFFFMVTGTVLVVYGAIKWMCITSHPVLGLVFDIFIFYSTFALRDLGKHAERVRQALENHDIDGARQAVQFLVGRDAKLLGSSGIARATIESVAESFVDSLLAPICWYTVGAIAFGISGAHPILNGVALALFYRTVNTMDSMVGYRNDRYRFFGTAAARADDLINFIPARICVVPLIAAAVICRLSPRAGIKSFLSDRKKSPSPNAAHPESFTAGAIGIALGGPVAYPHGLVDKPWLGNGTQEANASHIKQAWQLIATAGAIALIACLALTTIPNINNRPQMSSFIENENR